MIRGAREAQYLRPGLRAASLSRVDRDASDFGLHAELDSYGPSPERLRNRAGNTPDLWPAQHSAERLPVCRSTG